MPNDLAPSCEEVQGGSDKFSVFVRDILPFGRSESARMGFGFDPRIGVADALKSGTKGPCLFCVPIGTQRDEDPNMLRTPLEAQTAPDGEPLCRSGVGMGSCQEQVAAILQ